MEHTLLQLQLCFMIKDMRSAHRGREVSRWKPDALQGFSFFFVFYILAHKNKRV